MGCGEVRDHQNAISLACVGGDQELYCEVVETKQSDGQGAQEGAPEAGRKPLNVQALFLKPVLGRAE